MSECDMRLAALNVSAVLAGSLSYVGFQRPVVNHLFQPSHVLVSYPPLLCHNPPPLIRGMDARPARSEYLYLTLIRTAYDRLCDYKVQRPTMPVSSLCPNFIGLCLGSPKLLHYHRRRSWNEGLGGVAILILPLRPAI